MAEPTWETRERPILEAIAALEEQGISAASEHVAEATGIEPQAVALALSRLHGEGFITGENLTVPGDPFTYFMNVAMSGKGLRVVGVWPPTVADSFLGQIDQLIAETEDPEERSKWERLKEVAAEVGKRALAQAIVAAGTAAADGSI